MAGGRFSKQAGPYLNLGKSLNGNNATGDTVIGGAVTAVPTGLSISQFDQNLPGDRFIFSPADAYALSNNNVGLLYTGTYRYVSTRNNSTSVPQRAHAAFWDLITSPGNYTASNYQADLQYQVTSDEAANIGVAMFAGCYVNNITAGGYWFIQESGKMFCQWRATLTGTAGIGAGAYLAAAGNNNSNATVGVFDVLASANAGVTFSAANNNSAYLALDNMFVRFVGVAETLPVANTATLVDVTLSRASFRW